jgi:hypothetical protein
VWSTIPDIVPNTLSSADSLWGWFVEDLFHAEHPGGFRLDLGWYPDTSPDGAFALELQQGEQVVEVHRGRDPDVIVEAIERICQRLSSPAPTTAQELLTAIGQEPARRVLRALLNDCPPHLLTEAAATTDRADLALDLALAGIRSGEAAARVLAETWLVAAEEARATIGLQVLRAVDDQRASDALFRRLGQASLGSPLRIALATALGEMSHPPRTRRHADEDDPPLPGSPRLVRVALGLPPDPPHQELDAGPFPLAVIERKLATKPHLAERLLTRLADLGEPRAVETLILLRPPGRGAGLPPGLSPSLMESLQRWAQGDVGGVSEAARRALAALAPSAAASAAVAHDVASAPPVERLLAVDALAQQPDEAATAGLLDALLVDDFFVRTTAWDALLARTGTPPTTGVDDFGPLSALHLRVLTSIKAIWHPAATRARDLFRRLLAGEAHDAVLPAYVPGDANVRGLALAALRKGGDAPLDVEPLRLLEGHDRAWFEAALLTRVGRQDPRAIAAGASLDIKGLAGALHEARKRWAPMPDDVRDAVELALLHLGRPR